MITRIFTVLIVLLTSCKAYYQGSLPLDVAAGTEAMRVKTNDHRTFNFDRIVEVDRNYFGLIGGDSIHIDANDLLRIQTERKIPISTVEDINFNKYKGLIISHSPDLTLLTKDGIFRFEPNQIRKILIHRSRVGPAAVIGSVAGLLQAILLINKDSGYGYLGSGFYIGMSIVGAGTFALIASIPNENLRIHGNQDAYVKHQARMNQVSLNQHAESNSTGSGQ